MKIGRNPKSHGESRTTIRPTSPARNFHTLFEERCSAKRSQPDTRFVASSGRDDGLFEAPRETRSRTHRDAGTWMMTEWRSKEPVGEDEPEEVQTGVDRPLELQPASKRASLAVDRPATLAHSELDPVFDRVVREVVVMEDRHRRRRVRMRLSVRGKSDLDVEVVRQEHGVEVRFCTRDDELRDELRRRRTELTDRARDRGVAVADVRVG